MTSNTGRLYPDEALVTLQGKPAKAKPDQIMAADKNCLKSQLGTLSKPDMLAVEDAVKVRLGLAK